MTEAAQIAPRETLSVGQLNRYLKYLVEHDHLLKALAVRGEICEFSRSSNGHIYFAIKDSSGQLSCVLFRREAARQSEDVAVLRKGEVVVVHGFLTVYEPRGTYQMYVERVVPEGEGAFARRFERLKIKLESEGLFDAQRKRPLPAFPRTIALVTSPRSQAYHDVLHRLQVQYPFVKVIEAGVSVQGDGAADEMAMAIDIVNRLTDAEVILLVRGGGSPEDLAAFNHERVARAVFASRVPVITGVGHQTDYTIVDYVADFRAATPSLAAASAVPDARGVVQAMGALYEGLVATMALRLRAERRRWIQSNRSLVLVSPRSRLRMQRQQVDELARSQERAIDVVLRSRRARLAALVATLHALDPMTILARGYAVLSDAETGRVIARREDAVPGRVLRAQVADGEFLVRREDR